MGLSEAEFQLEHCGHLLQRDVPAERDPRVLTFNPDPWQRKVLPQLTGMIGLDCSWECLRMPCLCVSACLSAHVLVLPEYGNTHV